MRRRFTIHKGFTETFDFNNYLTIEALEDNLTVTFTNDIEYVIDGKEWLKLKAFSESQSISAGQTLSFRGEFTSSHTSNGIGTFTINKKCNLKGNCMSMLFGDNAANNHSLNAVFHDFAFACLFCNCSNIVSVSSNFLPATTLAMGCYYNMFGGCTSLTKAPELPATILASYCYNNMFDGCKKLNYIKCLATNISATNCTSNWVSGVSSTGAFVKAADMTRWETGSSGIPTGWTVRDA